MIVRVIDVRVAVEIVDHKDNRLKGKWSLMRVIDARMEGEWAW